MKNKNSRKTFRLRQDDMLQLAKGRDYIRKKSNR